MTAIIREAAERLWTAQHARTPIAPLTETHPCLDVSDAYGIQQINLGRRLAAGARLVGRKIGLSSAPMQTLLGVDEPDFGFIVDDMVIAGQSVATERFCAPRVEPEVAFLLKRPLRGPGVDTSAVYAATESVAVALEIVDSRIADWKLTLPDTVADNASSGDIILGDWVPYTAALALPRAAATLTLNGVDIDSGTGDAVMGDPAAAVAWLANALAEFGTELSAGQFIMSGSFTSAAFVHVGDVATATIAGLGTVSLTFT
ncbi:MULTISPECIES: fumarylacetoacetate hydrolase family protein [unclassified Mycobacterium]|uniref:2-keto-4-pentenoate hydratase n=1 Tax=unclassified Mycobacterium TaxID=2642494 RepID=UPI00073FC092|nr:MULTISPECIES: fumarylacetoacetate hydrolase family protein [unclassified Mycobacterium]KUH85581.1 2-keto-4-pentenoate hydratase [Mycobacterium sp. GA-1999]KUH91439.1 2-keto-4-pentenoate hydratase [Mycobacterium sp. GA-0227b]KUH96308.1 2-keto-4-pentenoate hydratase [Mycobacterium sp. IS-1556]